MSVIPARASSLGNRSEGCGTSARGRATRSHRRRPGTAARPDRRPRRRASRKPSSPSLLEPPSPGGGTSTRACQAVRPPPAGSAPQNLPANSPAIPALQHPKPLQHFAPTHPNPSQGGNAPGQIMRYLHLGQIVRSLRIRATPAWRQGALLAYRINSARGRGGIGRRNGLKLRIECAWGNPGRRTAQIRGTLSDGDPEPSPVPGEGVETRRAAPEMAKG